MFCKLGKSRSAVLGLSILVIDGAETLKKYNGGLIHVCCIYYSVRGILLDYVIFGDILLISESI